VGFLGICLPHMPYATACLAVWICAHGPQIETPCAYFYCPRDHAVSEATTLPHVSDKVPDPRLLQQPVVTVLLDIWDWWVQDRAEDAGSHLKVENADPDTKQKRSSLTLGSLTGLCFMQTSQS
jgi:hypothetical protein